jgi:hypothetical protein
MRKRRGLCRWKIGGDLRSNLGVGRKSNVKRRRADDGDLRLNLGAGLEVSRRQEDGLAGRNGWFVVYLIATVLIMPIKSNIENIKPESEIIIPVNTAKGPSKLIME